MDGATSPDAVELPLACSLDSANGRARMERWQALAARASPSASRQGPLLEVRFPALPGVLRELEVLAAEERVCCSFVDWEVVGQVDGEIVLRVSAGPGSPDDVAPIVALFGLD